ncbi:MAG TPA: hypothetical protein P5553_03630 [Desulfomonilia bacterium]|nr:hypothetical protein [Desulfomonilia bacterium]
MCRPPHLFEESGCRGIFSLITKPGFVILAGVIAQPSLAGNC